MNMNFLMSALHNIVYVYEISEISEEIERYVDDTYSKYNFRSFIDVLDNDGRLIKTENYWITGCPNTALLLEGCKTKRLKTVMIGQKSIKEVIEQLNPPCS
ncbi:MAG: hypothetical protein PHS92_00300 [Candidatus Gracilibacteria bacterium]|nr:hypothetical protein [Candidatus Gracilibacteria bacterium]